ncbi:unnamed protein product [Calicophoron daubneyi]|uniref:Cyanocobalamin reductase (cyanide-eliminating) n=1 Tax=Calicophoron daubneyi TaxID=300641 RepID=A0AAV2U194_CALDB
MIENQSGLFLVKNVLVTLRHLLHPYGFEIAPFLMGWYQEVVHSCGPGTKNAVGLHPHSVAFCIMSNPDMFDLSFLSHLSSWFRPGVNSFKQAIAPLQPILAQNINAPNRNDLLDWSVFLRLQSSLNACIREVSRSLSAEQQNAIGKVHYFPDYCLTPLPGLPFIHVQASAHVSGLAYFHRPSESMKKVTYKTTLAGCSMHPAYGGWFGLRIPMATYHPRKLLCAKANFDLLLLG